MEVVCFTFCCYHSQVFARSNKFLMVHCSSYLIRTRLPVKEWKKYTSYAGWSTDCLLTRFGAAVICEKLHRISAQLNLRKWEPHPLILTNQILYRLRHKRLCELIIPKCGLEPFLCLKHTPVSHSTFPYSLQNILQSHKSKWCPSLTSGYLQKPNLEFLDYCKDIWCDWCISQWRVFCPPAP